MIYAKIAFWAKSLHRSFSSINTSLLMLDEFNILEEILFDKMEGND